MPNLSNAEIAAVLERYGRLLEIAGESPFRVRALLRAGESVRDYPDPIANVARVKRLKSVPGVGAGIAAIITELIETGLVRSFVELQRTVPATLLELLEVPGLGSRTVSRLYGDLGITDLAGLEAAATAGRIRDLPGLGEKTEARIVAGIESLRRRTGRHRLGAVLPLGRRLAVDLLAALPSGSSVSLAGSVRRMEETVADLDLVVAAADLPRAGETVVRHGAVNTVLERTERTLRVELQAGVRADVTLTPPELFGTALVRATGNDTHLVLLGGLPATSSEEELYGRRGLPWIPPELRHGLDEIELARAGHLDTLITLEDVGGEFHCHTTWSDGTLPVLAMAIAARERGYRFLAISDHSRSLGVANGLDAARLAAQRREIATANDQSGIRVFAGAEVEVARDGRLDFDDEILAGLDVVIASTHVGLRQPREELTERLVGVLENRNVDIIAHPSGRLLEQREGGDFDWDRVFATAARTGTALEINADPARLDLSADHARRALAAGCLLTINCDAHHPDSFSLLEYGVTNARRAGVTPDRVLNCWPLDRIEAWLAGRGH